MSTPPPAPTPAPAPVVGPLTIAYVCGALKVTTRPSSRSTGPRAHVTGMIGGLRRNGHAVRPFLAGDLVPARASGAADGHGAMPGATWRGRALDAVRLGLNPVLGVGARAVGRGADVVYERQATYESLGSYRRRGTPWVVESNGPFWYEASVERGSLSYPGLAKSLEVGAYRRADLVVAVSSALKDFLVDSCTLDAEKVIVVPNAVDPERFPPRPAPVGARAPGPVVIGFVGHVIGWAGLDRLLEAVAGSGLTAVDIAVRVIGDGPAREALEAQARALGVTDRVSFLGHRSWDEVPDLLASFDVAFSGQVPMAVGSMYHSPLKLYEYSAAGLASIASDFPDARDLVTGAGAGWLVSPGDVEQLEGALCEVVERSGDLAAAGASAREHVLARHTWDRRAAQVVTGLHERGLLDRTGRAGA